ncbi:MAG: TonB-dependent receptor [Gammaproteobacteria bacterium]|nr:TonB-dependent receptor [Gammaproteobacteria bacterium]
MKKKITLAVVLACTSVAVFAETNNEEDPDAVVVTATRTAQTAFESLASVTVITREDIEDAQAQEVSDLLSMYPGLDVKQTGGAGTQTSIFLRGTESDHALVLVDGVRAFSATTGAFAWGSIPLSQIERIEIVRGPRASLYGSDAIGGVIQIFTRKNNGASAAVEGGTYGTKGAQAGWGYSSETSHLSFHVSSRETEGFSAQNENGGSFDPDKDGFNNDSITIHAGLSLPSRQKIELRTWRAQSETDYDIGSSEGLNQASSIVLKGNLTGVWFHSLTFGQSTDDYDSQGQSTFGPYAFRYITRRNTVDWQHDLSLGTKHLITAGANYLSENSKNLDPLTNTIQYDESVVNTAGFLSILSNIIGTDIQLSGRIDDHEVYGKHSTGQIALGRKLLPSTRLWVSYGSAFRAPDSNDLFFPFGGNLDLKPEESVTTEIGLKLKPSREQSVELNLFHTRIEELISYNFVTSKSENIEEVSIRGIEAVYTVNTKHWQARSSITAKTSQNDTDKSDLLNRPDQKVSINIDRHLGTSTVGTEILLVSEAADYGGGRLHGYGLASLRYAYSISKDLKLGAKAINITDKEYETVGGYNTPGRSYYLTLRYR